MNLKEKLLGDQWKLPAVIFSVATGVVVLIIGALFVSPIEDYFRQPPAEAVSTPDAEPVLGSPTSSSPDVTPTVSTTPTDSSSAAPTQSATPGGAPIFLTDMDELDPQNGTATDRSVEMGGELFIKSIRYAPCGACSYESSFLEYNLGKRYRTLTATIGVNDKAKYAEQVGFFIVYVDGHEAGRWEVRLGEPQRIEVSVAGGQRLKLEMGSADGNLSASDLAWGTPRLHP